MGLPRLCYDEPTGSQCQGDDYKENYENVERKYFNRCHKWDSLNVTKAGGFSKSSHTLQSEVFSLLALSR